MRSDLAEGDGVFAVKYGFSAEGCSVTNYSESSFNYTSFAYLSFAYGYCGYGTDFESSEPGTFEGTPCTIYTKLESYTYHYYVDASGKLLAEEKTYGNSKMTTVYKYKFEASLSSFVANASCTTNCDEKAYIPPTEVLCHEPEPQPQPHTGGSSSSSGTVASISMASMNHVAVVMVVLSVVMAFVHLF